MRLALAHALPQRAKPHEGLQLPPHCAKSPVEPIPQQNKETPVKPEEIRKLEAYLKRNLNPNMVVKARPRKDDSAEVYLEDEFLGVIYKDEEEGELSYNFSMAILDIDL